MDCNEFLNRLDEFVDGVAGVADEPARRLHVQSCASCQVHVRTLTAVGDAVRHAWKEVCSPAELRADVRRSLADQASKPTADRSPSERRASFLSERRIVTRASGRLRRSRLILVTLAVATVVVVSIGTWQIFNPPRPQTPVVVYVKNSVIEDALARHRWCSREEHVFHYDSDLPMELPAIASTLEADLGLEVQAPGLMDWGYSFLGARRCRVAGRPVAHLLYFAPRDKTMLSLFSMYRVHDLRSSSRDTDRLLYFSLHGAGDNVLAWNEGRQTYALISPAPQKSLLAIGEALRASPEVALSPPTTGSLASATCWGW